MQIAYIDESGYTGRDLLDHKQPFMSLSAIFISSEKAIELRSKHFPQMQAPELKHNRLVRRPIYHTPLLEIQRTCLDIYRAVSYVVDKRYMCILKFLDDCIEPICHTHGLDFYEDGQHLALASLLYYAAPTLWGKSNVDKLLRLYQQASINKTDESIDDLCQHVQSIKKYQETECLLPIAVKHPAFIEEIKSSSSSTNIAFSLLFALITRLEEFAGREYEIIHDRSPAMKRYHSTLKIIMDKKPSSFRISNVCELSYPLHLTNVREADSKSEIGLQLADLLAGGIISGIRALTCHDKGNSYGTNVMRLYSDNNIIFMLPNADIEEIHNSFANNQMSAAINDITRSLK